MDGDARPNGSRRATPRKADRRFDSGPLPCDRRNQARQNVLGMSIKVIEMNK